MDIYDFEEENPSFGSEQEVKDDLNVFKKRIGLEIAGGILNLQEKDEKLMRAYVIASQRAADWYNKSRKKRRDSHKSYARGRIVVLVALPIAILLITKCLDNETVVAQTTVVLTALMAAYRASSQWIEAKFAAENFSKAASELKEKIYAFEAAWSGKIEFENGNELTNELRTALREGILQAREIARKQREAYFAATKPPALDVMTMLEQSRTNVLTLLTNYQSPKLAQALKLEEEAKAQDLARDTLLGEIAKLTATLEAREKLIEKKKEEMEQEEAGSDRKGALDKLLKALRSAQDATEQTLSERSGALAALNKA